MARQKARKIVVAYTVTLPEELRAVKLKELKERCSGEGQYIAEALGADGAKVVTSVAE